MAAKWTKVGTVRKAKSGKTSYVQFDIDVTLKAGMRLQLQDPRVKLDESVKAGRIEAEKAEEFKSKIPEYITREVFLVQE